MQKAYRHELKYYINQKDYILLSKRLRETLQSDANTDQNGEYFIRSLYFDDLNDSAFRHKLDGIDDRDKFRIRIYNMSSRVIKLECKHKDGQYICKQSISLSSEEYQRIMMGDYTFLLRRNEPFARRMFAEFATKRLQPRVIVDYMREPYVFPLQDVRITFDKDIRTAYRSVDMFNRNLPTYPVITEGDMVLEVKYNEYLPTHIRTLLQIGSPLRSAISKYCLCRKMEL
ncbi:MAG: polyphosphate polymerase domain-containing protein [Clostridia bacterium]|nr:polyphosphate polymerase domain-containing protein [Clostridia bacterium]